ncbi:hypothetical protein NLI96_g7286 [Meripilus lineatus]|uniref:Kinesin-like protein n=1 Tax=Meripilus lineatus TaxID=2056292 RepID=A0AAD5YD37_9APHY|nr:hypothetical protein NLI96_g7286 [Physisporinus lineatus]
MRSVHPIRIVARLRPPLPGELCDSSLDIENPTPPTQNQSQQYISIKNPRDSSQVFKFQFNSCYGADSTQNHIFSNEVRYLIDIIFQGMLATVFAYGVTSSGKTHTMQGTADDPGIIPRAVEEVLQHKSQLPSSASAQVAMSYMEIYKDEVYDLLTQRENSPKLSVRENSAGEVFVANLSSRKIDDISDFETIYFEASKRRSVASTNLNRVSSRSHAILTLTIKVSLENKTLTGKLNLVDLAGSENNKITGNDPTRMAESSAINKSLSVLGQVVHALNQGASRIPYRDSKLTRLLQDALGGSSLGLLICNISPAAKFRQDTLNTLNFAVRTKNIQNKVVVHEKENVASQQTNTNVSTPRKSSIFSPDAQRKRAANHPKHSNDSKLPQPHTHLESFPPSERYLMMSEDEINKRIARAVDAEVTRRLAEERAKFGSQLGPVTDTPHSMVASSAHTPIDGEVQHREEPLESRTQQSGSECRLADMSPLSRKRTGRAYVALARAQTEKNNLQNALELYRKAEAYVPGNVKLKERWILFVVHVFMHMTFSDAKC